jgi:hypothetical protein
MAHAIGVQPKVLAYMEQNYKYMSILSIQWWFNFCWSFFISMNEFHYSTTMCKNT